MIIDFYSKQQTDNKLVEKADIENVYQKNETMNIEEIDNAIDTKIAQIDIPDVSDFYTKSEVYTKTQVDNLLTPKANATDVYNKTQVDNLVLPKANSSDVYSKSETYTKTEVGNLLSPKANSSDVYSQSETYSKTETDNLVSPKANSSDVYPKTDTYSKNEVDVLLNNLPVYNGVIKVDVNATFETISSTHYLRFGNYTPQEDDLLILDFRFTADSGTIEAFETTATFVFHNDTRGFGVVYLPYYVGFSNNNINNIIMFNYSKMSNNFTIVPYVSGVAKIITTFEIRNCYVLRKAV